MWLKIWYLRILWENKTNYWWSYPPKNIFSQPRPHNLITVPSCYKCNLGSSDDDEYFRFSIAIREDLFEHQDIQKIYPNVIRSLDKPNKIGFRNSFLSTIREIESFTNAGIFLGYKHTYDVDFVRLGKVANRIVKGLYYHHLSKIIPQNYLVQSYVLEGMKNTPPHILYDIKKNVFEPLRKSKTYKIGDVFEYKYSCTNEDAFTSAWIMRFYQKVYFFGISLPLISDN